MEIYFYNFSLGDSSIDDDHEIEVISQEILGNLHVLEERTYIATSRLQLQQWELTTPHEYKTSVIIDSSKHAPIHTQIYMYIYSLQESTIDLVLYSHGSRFQLMPLYIMWNFQFWVRSNFLVQKEEDIYGAQEMYPTVIYYDNHSFINLSKNLVFHDESKHIDIWYHHL